VDFEADAATGSEVLADGYGTTIRGVDVGVILWGRNGQLSGLEVYALEEDTPDLPTPESLSQDGGVLSGQGDR
jgi:hypothetical protein